MNAAALIAHIDASIARASQLDSKLPPFVMEIDGMSSAKGRHMFNNILSYREGDERLRYLEVGSWKGSLFCSATYNNPIDAVSIDNFSEFLDATFTNDHRHPRQARSENVLVTRALSHEKANVRLIERDMFSLMPDELANLGRFDVFLYDGLHGYDAHYQAFKHMDPCLNDTFVALIDDYDVSQSVHEATNRAWAELGYTSLKDWYRLTDYGAATEEEHLAIAKREWWNGYRISVVQKGARQ